VYPTCWWPAVACNLAGTARTCCSLHLQRQHNNTTCVSYPQPQQSAAADCHTPASCSSQLIDKRSILNPRGASTPFDHECAEPRVCWPLAQHVDVGLVAATVLQVNLVQLPWRFVQALVVDQPCGLQRKEEALRGNAACNSGIVSSCSQQMWACHAAELEASSNKNPLLAMSLLDNHCSQSLAAAAQCDAVLTCIACVVNHPGSDCPCRTPRINMQKHPWTPCGSSSCCAGHAALLQ
jgi:hypothetical protein